MKQLGKCDHYETPHKQHEDCVNWIAIPCEHNHLISKRVVDTEFYACRDCPKNFTAKELECVVTEGRPK